jgi:hypothetical protein
VADEQSVRSKLYAAIEQALEECAYSHDVLALAEAYAWVTNPTQAHVGRVPVTR